MKKFLLILLSLLLIMTISCTANEAAWVVIEDSTPVDVLIDDSDPVDVEFEEPIGVSVNNTPLQVSVNNTPNVRVVDTDGDIINIDEATRTIVAIEYEHFEIHHGHTFTVLEVTDLQNGEVRDVLVITPDTTEWAHLVWEIEHELETSIQFYRGTTYSDNGTPILAFNRNDNSSNNSTTLVYHTPTIIDVGISKGIIQQGDGKKAGGSDREANEFILRQNTAYLIRITNLTVNNNLIGMKLNWYEHIDLN